MRLNRVSLVYMVGLLNLAKPTEIGFLYLWSATNFTGAREHCVMESLLCNYVEMRHMLYVSALFLVESLPETFVMLVFLCNACNSGNG